MSAVEPRQLAAAVQQELAAAAQGAAQRMKSAITAAGTEGARTVQTLSPRRTGAYARGWKSRTAYESAESIRVEISNGRRPPLAHLLEDGHAVRGTNGRRRAAARPHLVRAQEEIAERLNAKVRVMIR